MECRVSRQLAITNCRLWTFLETGRWSARLRNPLGMEAITRMECRLLHGYDLDFSPNKWRWKFGPALNLLVFLLLFLVLLLGSLLSRGLLLTLRSLRISGLLARSHSEPLGQLLGGAL